MSRFIHTPSWRIAVLFLLVSGSAMIQLPGCASTTIAIKESFGYAKREQLVDQVQGVRDGQVEAKDQFKSTLERFLAVTGVKDESLSKLESRYNDLKNEYEDCQDSAANVHDRIASVQAVADALFDEWNAELKQYTNPELRKASEQQMKDTRAQYAKVLAAMKAAEARMTPVLAAFKDQVLFLKHNLNARAIASLQNTATQLQTDVSSLIREMESSIAQANEFISQMQAQGG